MAKKKSNATRVARPAIRKHIDNGPVFPSHVRVSGPPDEVMSSFMDYIRQLPTPKQVIAEVEAHLRHVLGDFLRDSPEDFERVRDHPTPGDWVGVKLPDDPPRELQDAKVAWGEYRSVQSHRACDDWDGAIVAAMRMGAAVCRIQVRAHEHDITTGRNIRRSLEGARVAKLGSEESRRQRANQIFESVERLRSGRSLLDACRLVAEECEYQFITGKRKGNAMDAEGIRSVYRREERRRQQP